MPTNNKKIEVSVKEAITELEAKTDFSTLHVNFSGDFEVDDYEASGVFCDITDDSLSYKGMNGLINCPKEEFEDFILILEGIRQKIELFKQNRNEFQSTNCYWCL